MTFSGVSLMNPDNASLIDWGANYTPVTLEGQWWRLFTCCFVHIGAIHLLMNLYALRYIGVLLEPLLGKSRFLAAYMLAGIAGSAVSLYWHAITISAGASGAIFGMYGVFLAMLTTNLVDKTARKTLLSSILIFVGYNLVNGLRGGIDNAAHIGGLTSGLAMGYAFYPSLIRPAQPNLKYVTMGMLTALILSTTFLVYTETPNTIGQYQAAMRKFGVLESAALEVYQENERLSNGELPEIIKTRGIPAWKESIRIIQDADQLDLPEALHVRNKKLLEYCKLRIRSFELILKAVDGNSGQYQAEITETNTQIENVIKELEDED